MTLGGEIFRCFIAKTAKYVSNLTNPSNFHPLEVVGRGSETQLQVGEKIKSYKLALKRFTTSTET